MVRANICPSIYQRTDAQTFWSWGEGRGLEGKPSRAILEALHTHDDDDDERARDPPTGRSSFEPCGNGLTILNPVPALPQFQIISTISREIIALKLVCVCMCVTKMRQKLDDGSTATTVVHSRGRLALKSVVSKQLKRERERGREREGEGEGDRHRDRL